MQRPCRAAMVLYVASVVQPGGHEVMQAGNHGQQQENMAGHTGVVGLTYVGDELVDDEPLAGEAPVVRVLVERALAAVGEHHQHRRPAPGGDALVQATHVVERVELVAPGSV